MLLAQRPSAFHRRTLRELGGGEDSGGVEGWPGPRDVGEEAEEGDIEWADGGIRGLETRVGQKCSISRGGTDCTLEVYMSEESEEGVTVLR